MPSAPERRKQRRRLNASVLSSVFLVHTLAAIGVWSLSDERMASGGLPAPGVAAVAASPTLLASLLWTLGWGRRTGHAFAASAGAFLLAYFGVPLVGRLLDSDGGDGMTLIYFSATAGATTLAVLLLGGAPESCSLLSDETQDEDLRFVVGTEDLVVGLVSLGVVLSALGGDVGRMLAEAGATRGAIVALTTTLAGVLIWFSVLYSPELSPIFLSAAVVACLIPGVFLPVFRFPLVSGPDAMLAVQFPFAAYAMGWLLLARWMIVVGSPPVEKTHGHWKPKKRIA